MAEAAATATKASLPGQRLVITRSSRSLDPSFQVEKEEPESDPPVEEEKNEDPPDDTDFSSWEKHQLMDYIEKQTGVRPHHAKGFNNLVTIAESNTK